MNLTTKSDRGRASPRLLAALIAAGATAMVPTTAEATCTDPNGCGYFTLPVGALVSSALGLASGVVGFLPFLAPSAKWANVNRSNTGVVAYFSATGGVAIGLGGLGIGLQAASKGPCDSACRAAYGLGGAGMGLGALLVSLGIYASVTPAPPGWHARLVPVPVAIPALAGWTAGLRQAGAVAPGVGLAGFGF
jgi:hypothetical protein